jgi:ubiquinone/menaquinone biosynthesis C-methylase UbiE
VRHIWLADFGSPLYDWITAQEVWRSHIRSLISRFPPGARRILDLGTGPAVSAIVFAESLPDSVVTGLDLSEGMLNRARPRVAASGARDRIQLVRGDAHQLPFPDGFADAVAGHSFLYLMPDRARALSEAKRVLRAGGQLVLLEPQQGFRFPRWALWRKSLRFGISMFLWRIVSQVEGRFSTTSLGDLISAAGFVDVHVEPTLGGLGLIASARA